MQQVQTKKKFQPRWMYHKDKGGVIVKSEAHLKSLGADWADSPSAHGVVTHPPSPEQQFGSEPEFFEEEEDFVDEGPGEPPPPPTPKPSRSRKKE